MRRLLSTTKPDIIFLQETLVDEEKARKFMFSLCPTWMYSVVRYVGKSGGLLAVWNPNIVDLQPYLCDGDILLTGGPLLDILLEAVEKEGLDVDKCQWIWTFV
jgi:hypothetical protein